LQLDIRQQLLILVSELVSNSVIHGGAGEGDEIGVSLAWTPERLRVEVRDFGPGFGKSLAGSLREGGWGLQLVEQLSDRWGVTRTDSTTVWFEKRLPTASRHLAA
jgi:anti-sigma regulatory factor (Ser/Thr protein kinase)